MTTDFQVDAILDVAWRGGRDPVAMTSPRGEFAIRCPWSAEHSHGDAHPSCRLNSDKNTFYCDPCGKGGGVVELARLLNVDSPPAVPLSQASGSNDRSRKRRTLHFESTGAVTAATRAFFASQLAKRYRDEAWDLLGALEGSVDREPAIAFPMPGGGFKACMYRRPDPKREKPYSFVFTDGGKADLLMIGDGDDVLLVAGEWDMLAALSAGFRCVATGTGGEGTWKPVWATAFKGKRVFVIYDVDAAGREGAAKVRTALKAAGVTVHVVELPLSGDNDKDGKDLSDYLALHSADDLRTLLAEPRQNDAGLAGLCLSG